MEINRVSTEKRETNTHTKTNKQTNKDGAKQANKQTDKLSLSDDIGLLILLTFSHGLCT